MSHEKKENRRFFFVRAYPSKARLIEDRAAYRVKSRSQVALRFVRSAVTPSPRESDTKPSAAANPPGTLRLQSRRAVGRIAVVESIDDMNWLDTQTKEMLQKVPDAKLAPPKVADFALVLVRKGVLHRRIVRAVSEINHCSAAEATKLVNRPTPVTINPDLTEEAALSGQFELIASDSISVFVRSEVLEQSDPAYLQSLFAKVLQSIEFSPTTVRVIQVPETEAGAKFIDQFLGGRFPKRESPVAFEVTFKKARMMKHWASRVGAEIQVDGDGDVDGAAVPGSLGVEGMKPMQTLLLPIALWFAWRGRFLRG
jgi:hypothetical protein